MTKLFECYVANPTHDEAVEIVEWLAANGAEVFEALNGMKVKARIRYIFHSCSCWGFKEDAGTYTHNPYSNWATRSKQLTMQEFRDAFPCEKYDGVIEEWPQPGNNVVVNHNGKFDAIFIGKTPYGTYVCQMPKGYEGRVYDGFHKSCISKPKSDRDKFIEAAVEAVGGRQAVISADSVFGKLYDADFKAPEEK